MARWQPDARGRLEAAALDLVERDGYEQTTAARIAATAGLTERTFFRHFGSKREALFAGQEALERTLVEAVRAAPAGDSPRDAIAAGFRAMSDRLEPRRDVLVRRARLVAAHPELQERELHKLASLGAVLAAALADRGVPQARAAVAGEVAVTVFRVAFDRWTAGDGSFPAVAEATLVEVQAVFAP